MPLSSVARAVCAAPVSCRTAGASYACGGVSMGRNTSVYTSASRMHTPNTVLAVRKRLSRASRSAAACAAYSARRRAALALTRFARRSQRSTNNATCGPMVSDAMARMSRNSTSPILIGLFPLFVSSLGRFACPYRFSIAFAARQCKHPPQTFFRIFPAKDFFAARKYAIIRLVITPCTNDQNRG